MVWGKVTIVVCAPGLLEANYLAVSRSIIYCADRRPVHHGHSPLCRSSPERRDPAVRTPTVPAKPAEKNRGDALFTTYPGRIAHDAGFDICLPPSWNFPRARRQYTTESGATLNSPATPDPRSNDQLLRRGRAGDEQAFLTLYNRHQPSIFRFALHMSGSREIADEVVQEVFLTLLADPITYCAERGTLEAFLIGMARNQVRQQLRQARGPEFPATRPSLQPRIPDDTSFDHQLEALHKAILSLPESYRAVTVLCDLEELSYAEAARRLECAVGTVRSRLHRARSILQAKLRRSQSCPLSTIK